MRLRFSQIVVFDFSVASFSFSNFHTIAAMSVWLGKLMTYFIVFEFIYSCSLLITARSGRFKNISKYLIILLFENLTI